MPINTQLLGSSSPVEPRVVFSSNAKRRLVEYQVRALSDRRTAGKKPLWEVDRIGLSGPNLTFKDSTEKSQESRTIDAAVHRSAVAFLLDWLETQQVFASVKAVGHRVVYPRQALRAHAIHRLTRRGPAGDSELEMGADP